MAVPVRRHGRPKPEMDKGANWGRKKSVLKGVCACGWSIGKSYGKLRKVRGAYAVSNTGRMGLGEDTKMATYVFVHGAF